MRTATVYLAVDGRQFQDAKPAKDHEDRLFEAWLKDNPAYRDFLKAPETTVGPTEAERRAVIREFWEWNYGK